MKNEKKHPRRAIKIALVYDRVNKWGGAERVLLALHKIFPKAPLYTSVYDKTSAKWAKVFDVRPSFLQKFPFALRHHDWYASLMPIAFESFNFDKYDVVISVTSEAAKGIVTKPGTLHICLSLTPTRYLWSGYKEYFHNPFLRFFAMPIVILLRKWDFAAAQRPDVYLAISNEVAKRIKKYYKKTAQVIYPPLQLQPSRMGKTSQNDFFLVVSRLVPYKRIDIAVEAANKLQIPLKIIGSGSQRAYLQSIAGSSVEFVGEVSDQELHKYYKNCIALLFPGFEDFGLTVIEAQSFGKPVIAYKAGGAKETIIEGKTGEFFTTQSANALTQRLQLLLKSRRMNIGQQKRNPYFYAARKNARQFTYARFKKELLTFIKKELNRKI